MNHPHHFRDSESDSDTGMPDSNEIVRAWLDIPDRERSPDRSAAHATSSSCDGYNHTLHDIDGHEPYQLPHHTLTYSASPIHCRQSVLPNLIPSPPPVRLSGRTVRNVNQYFASSRDRNQISPIGWGDHPKQQHHTMAFPFTHRSHPEHPSGPIFLWPSAGLLADTSADSPSTPRTAANPSHSPTEPETLASTSSPFLVSATGSATIAADSNTFMRNLSCTVSSSSKPKRSYASQSHTSVTSDIRAKRRAMQRLSPPLYYVFGPLPSPPPSVTAFLARFDMARIEYSCIPWTPAVEALLQTHNPLAYYPPHARNTDISESEEPRALALATWAISVYGLIINCTERAQDEATWSTPVRQLLSIMPPSPGSCIPIPPTVVACNQLLTTIDATTKVTRKSILSHYPTVKVDALVAFNSTHPALHSITRAVDRHGLVVNALSDAAIDDCVVLVGVEIKAPTGDAAPATAEYQLAVWGAKTLEVARQLGVAGSSDWCDVAIGLTVCGHTWSAYVVFWDVDEDNERTVVVYGPVEVASSANLYGVFKLIAWMAEVNVWAVEVLECWKTRVADARERMVNLGA